MSLGIDALKKMLEFGFALQQAIGHALQDKKIDFTDVVHLMGPLQALPSALGVLGDVIPEVKDLEDAEIEALKAYAKEKFDLADDELEAKIENSLDAVFVIYKAAMLWVPKK